MCSDIHSHSPSHRQSYMDITGSMIVQAVEVRDADESIPSDEESKPLSVKTFSLDAYTEEEILIFIGELVDAKHPLHNI